MPLIKRSTYRAPGLLKNTHIQTIFQSLIRRVRGIKYIRERITTPDNDFLDLDWVCNSSENAAILLHGMEGHSKRVYMLGMVNALNKQLWDSCVINFRGCSGETNRNLTTYHAGKSEDLDTVIKHVVSLKKYRNIVLIGFSLGGNIVLKFLGENRKYADSIIKCSVCISVPLDLTASAWKLAEKSNSYYMNRFLKKFHTKIQLKMEMFPGEINDNGFEKLKNFKDYDGKYTAPLNGFKSAEDYWEQSSSKQFLKNIKIPALIINAGNDPFLTPECFPVKEAEENSNLFLEVPKSGGHVGFITFNSKNEYWHESRVLEFIKTHNQ